jgi:hypothetical protein
MMASDWNKTIQSDAFKALSAPALSASPAPASDLVEAALLDPATVHINMLRGGIAKPTPAQIGHLYRGDEAAEVIAEVARQNPDAARALIAAMQPGQRDTPHCQSCGGEIQGWTCQGCGLTFRENEAGRLVAEPLPAPPGVGG